MKTALRVVGLLLAATAVAMAQMRTWTFEKSGKTMQGEVVGFAGDTVTIKRPDGQAFSVPIAYLTESNRVDLAAERVKQWKEVEVVKLEGVTSAGRYRRCIVQGKEVNGEILIQLLPASVEAILNSRNQQAAQIADLAERIENQDHAVQRADLVTPIGAGGDPAYVDAVMAQRKQVNLASLDVTDAKVNLAKLQAAYADYIDKTRAATTVKMITVKMKNIGFVYEGLPVWEILLKNPHFPTEICLFLSE
jgi:hypothetical protein